MFRFRVLFSIKALTRAWFTVRRQPVLRIRARISIKFRLDLWLGVWLGLDLGVGPMLR
jgi:hypothetical protein